MIPDRLHSRGRSEALADVLAVLIGDGAYDRQMCYAAARKHRGRLLTPPSKRAVLHAGPAWAARNTAIEEVRFLGKPEWQRSVHYGRRSLAESAMHRLKAAFGSRLRSRIAAHQSHAALLRAPLLNRWPTPASCLASVCPGLPHPR